MLSRLIALFRVTAPVVVLAACATTPPAAASVAAPSSTTVTVVAPPSATVPVAPAPASPPRPGLVIMGQIESAPGFDPTPVLTGLKPEFLRCYDETRSLVTDLHGKLMLRVHVDGSGKADSVDAQPGPANDPGLVACLGDAMKGATFPKPGGMATIAVPLVFKR